MKKVFAILLTLVLILTNGITVLAEEVSTPPANQISNNPNYSCTTMRFYNIGSNNLKEGEDGLSFVMLQGSISRSGSSIIAYGYTEANLSCDPVGGTVRIQRWKNNKWNTYYSFNFKGYGVRSFSGTQTVSVEPGFYYRVQVSHRADTLYSTIYATSTTSSIYIN